MMTLVGTMADPRAARPLLGRYFGRSRWAGLAWFSRIAGKAGCGIRRARPERGAQVQVAPLRVYPVGAALLPLWVAW